MVNKACFVPLCRNTTSNAPKKLFLGVPRNKGKRLHWIKAINVKEKETIAGLRDTVILYCCEDHFDLKEDAENWTFFTMMGAHLRLKDGVVPHLKLDNRNGPNRVSQFSDSMRKDKLRNTLAFREEKSIESLTMNSEPAEPNFCFVSSGLNQKCLVNLGLVDKESFCNPNNLDLHVKPNHYDPLITKSELNNFSVVVQDNIIIKPELIIKSED